MRARVVLGSLIAAALPCACAADQYVYRPTEQATAVVSGLPAARYAVPPERPLGDVLVASYGVVALKFEDDHKSNMIGLRMVVENNSDDAPWTVDAREQEIVLRSGGRSGPTYVNSDGEGSPVFQVLRGQKRTVDLYYPMPAGTTGAAQLPEFDFMWNVHTAARPIAQRTPFERLKLEPIEPAYSSGWGVAPYWWYDPLWPGASYAVAPSFYYYNAHPWYAYPVRRPAPPPPHAIGGGPPAAPVAPPAQRVR